MALEMHKIESQLFISICIITKMRLMNENILKDVDIVENKMQKFKHYFLNKQSVAWREQLSKCQQKVSWHMFLQTKYQSHHLSIQFICFIMERCCVLLLHLLLYKNVLYLSVFFFIQVFNSLQKKLMRKSVAVFWSSCLVVNTLFKFVKILSFA